MRKILSASRIRKCDACWRPARFMAFGRNDAGNAYLFCKRHKNELIGDLKHLRECEDCPEINDDVMIVKIG